MKKLLTLALAAVLALSLVACGGSGSIKDGTYTAQYKEPSHDWTEYLSVTYKDGVITDVDFDAKDANGNLKSEATAETYPMDPLPSEWIPQLEENVNPLVLPIKSRLWLAQLRPASP